MSSLRKVPDALSQLGHEVAVLSDIEQPGKTQAGVYWYSKRMVAPAFLEDAWDVLVANRSIYDGFPDCISRRRVLWTHDLPHPGFIKNPRLMQHFHTVFMSRYAEWVWRLHYPMIRKSSIIPNGVNVDLFHTAGEKDLDHVVFISNPNRGLHRLPVIAESVNGKIGRALRWEAYSNQAILHPMEGDCNNEGSRDNFGDMAIKGSGVDLKDPVSQPELAGVLQSAGLMVLPTGYPEICSNAVLQALACGVPIVTADIGSVGEWVRSGKNGYLTQSRLHDYFVYLVEIARAVVNIISDKETHKKLIRGAAATGGIYSWEQIGAKWDRMLKGIL